MTVDGKRSARADVETIACDVLIVGGGLAALVAALEARRRVDRVVVACKRKLGRSGNTIVSGAAFSFYSPSPDNPDSMDQHYADTIRAGAGINDPALVSALTAEGGAAVLGLEEAGVRFLRSGGSLVRRTPPGHSRPRSIPTALEGYAHATRGLSVTVPLQRLLERSGVRILNHCPVFRLTVRDGVAGGALAFHARSGAVVRIDAKATVLASGGGGHLFARTNNTIDMTGDSFALALDAGAVLRDMEFVQFYPSWALAPFRTAVSSPLFGEGAVLRNREGERFMQRYAPEGDMATRDVMSRAIFAEVMDGRGIEGGVYMDLSAVPETALKSKFSTMHKLFRARGFDPSRQRLIISPAAHFVMGGLWIDPEGGTDIPGLFAAGEAGGGVHGANRLAGNALTETVVFGTRAGRAAGGHAGRTTAVPHGRTGVAADLPGGNGKGTQSLAEVRKELRRSLWRHAGIARTDAGLEHCQAVLGQCREALPRCAVEGNRGIADYQELERMITVAEAILAAARLRTESRGAHYREDRPASGGDDWLGSTRVRRSDDGLDVRFVPQSGPVGGGDPPADE